jgi:hypothetical protein
MTDFTPKFDTPIRATNNANVVVSRRVTVAATSGHKPASEVFAPSNRLQMVRIDAQTVAAEMVEVHPFGDRPLYKLVQHSMGGGFLTFECSGAVAAGVTRPSPHPAIAIHNDGCFL